MILAFRRIVLIKALLVKVNRPVCISILPAAPLLGLTVSDAIPPPSSRVNSGVEMNKFPALPRPYPTVLNMPVLSLDSVYEKATK
jgi:hypothetical protein